MSIETLLSPAEMLPPAPAATSPVVPADSGPPVTASLQERRLRAARELDARIRRLEQETLQLAAALEAARRGAREHLGELQQRSTSLTTEVLRVGARLARQGRDQDEQRRLLDHRLCQRLRELEASLEPLGEALRAQAGQLQELQARHETLARLHEHLDRIVSRQGRGLDIVAAEFEQRVELLRVSLEGIQALFRDQQESQLRIAVEQESLAAVAQALQARLDDTRADIDQHRQDTRRQLQALTSLLATLALVSLSLLAWCQFHPVALPRAAQHQLATLDSRLSLQDGSNARLALALSRHTEELGNVNRELQRVQRDNQRLRQETRRQQTRLARMAAHLASVALPSTAATARSTAPGEERQADAETHWAPPGNTPLPLPAAVPGSRADF